MTTIDSETFTQDMLVNPTKLMNAMIDEIEKSDETGATVINDPNSGFVIQMAASSHIYSLITQRFDADSQNSFANRSRNMEQLLHHVSEFDYVKLMAAPAVHPFLFAMSKAWILENAVYFDENYNKIQVPATSYMTMGGIRYSMYYPIDIFVNRNTSAITAFYNKDFDDRLYNLESNMLIKTSEFTSDGIDYFSFVFNMFQFKREVFPFTLSSEQGFVKTLNYEDKFYAVKVFNRLDDGTWSELSYSLSQKYYDYTKPTVLITVLSDRNAVRLNIPQIYFTKKQITKDLKVELYTTKGKIDISLTAEDAANIEAQFDTRSTPFAAPLDQPPTWRIYPTAMEVEGGSDPMTYDEIRSAVVDGGIYDRVPVSNAELEVAVKKAGFDGMIREVDDLTDRMYYVVNTLKDNSGMVIPTFVGNLLISNQALEGNPSSIIEHGDGYYTIQPTTVFKVGEDSTTCVPLTDGEIIAFQNMTKLEQVNLLNQSNYVRQPFHITLFTQPKSPAAQIYNLLSPKQTALNFIRENPNSAPQMSALVVNIQHQNNGVGGFRILITAQRSSNILNEDINTFKMILSCTNKIGDYVFLPATHIGYDNNGDDVWEVILATDYHISTDDFLSVVMLDNNANLSNIEIPLTQKFNIISMFTSSFAPTIQKDSTLNLLLPDTYTAAHTVMSHQTVIIELGVNLSESIYCGVNTTWGSEVYDVATETVYHETTTPVFQKNENGVIETKYNTDTSALEITQIYDIGDVVASTGDFDRKTAGVVTIATGTTTIPVDDITGILKGMPVRGTNIPVNSLVIDIIDDTIVIDKEATLSVSIGTELTFTNSNPMMRTTAAQVAIGPQLTVASTTDIRIGHSVFGLGLDTGSVVASIDSATEFTLNKDTLRAVGNDTLLTFINQTEYGVVKIRAGEVLKDATGKAIVLENAKNEYSIPCIMFDGRMFVSDDPADQAVIGKISEKLQSYANRIREIDASFIEDANVFYRPDRSMGLAQFSIGNDVKVRIPLSLSLSVSIYVDTATYSSENALENIRENVYPIVNEEFQKSIISTANISKIIKDRLGDTIVAVRCSGINNNEDLHVLTLKDKGCTPGVEQRLFYNSDGTTDRRPNIAVNFFSKPE